MCNLVRRTIEPRPIGSRTWPDTQHSWDGLLRLEAPSAAAITGDAMLIIYRNQLMNPDALEWIWRSWEVPVFLQKPKWVQLATGHWMKVHQVEEELVQGEIVPWEAFKMMMRADRARYLKLYAQFGAGFLTIALCVIGGVGAMRLVLHPAFIELRVMFIGLLLTCTIIALLVSTSTFAKWRELSFMSIIDPGPNPLTMQPRQVVEASTPHGPSSGFADPSDTVRDLGAGDNMWRVARARPKSLDQ
jgi:hypothetical protein